MQLLKNQTYTDEVYMRYAGESLLPTVHPVSDYLRFTDDDGNVIQVFDLRKIFTPDICQQITTAEEAAEIIKQQYGIAVEQGYLPYSAD